MTDQEITEQLTEAADNLQSAIEAIAFAGTQVANISRVIANNKDLPEFNCRGGALWSIRDSTVMLHEAMEFLKDAASVLKHPVTANWYPLVLYHTVDYSSTLRILYPPGANEIKAPDKRWVSHSIVLLPPRTAQSYANDNLEGKLP